VYFIIVSWLHIGHQCLADFFGQSRLFLIGLMNLQIVHQTQNKMTNATPPNQSEAPAASQ
jgi:hypothetical protein